MRLTSAINRCLRGSMMANLMTELMSDTAAMLSWIWAEPMLCELAIEAELESPSSANTKY